MLLLFYYTGRCNKCTVNDSLLPLKTHSRVHIRQQPWGVNPYVQEGEDSSRQQINLTAAQTVTALFASWVHQRCCSGGAGGMEEDGRTPDSSSIGSGNLLEFRG